MSRSPVNPTKSWASSKDSDHHAYTYSLHCPCEALGLWLPIECQAKTDKTSHLYRLIGIFGGHTWLCRFCHAPAQIWTQNEMNKSHFWLINTTEASSWQWTYFYINEQLKWQNEAAHEIMALFVLHKHILQMFILDHPVGLDVCFLVGPFIYFHTSCVQTAKALPRLPWSPMW